MNKTIPHFTRKPTRVTVTAAKEPRDLTLGDIDLSMIPQRTQLTQSVLSAKIEVANMSEAALHTVV